jgi:hypothetical protein
MTNPITVKYDWHEALAHLQLLGHRGVVVTKIAAFRAKPPGPLRYIGVFEPTKYHLAISGMRNLQREFPTLSFFVGFNPLSESALEYAPNRFVFSTAEPKKTDVASVINMVLDIDPFSERDESSQEERQAVLTVANDILDTEPLLAEASLIDSGHGAYLVARLPPGPYDWNAVKAFCDELRVRYFSKSGVAGKAKLEVPGPSQLMGLAGTANTKWAETIWRPRRLLHRGGVCNALAERLLAWRPPVNEQRAAQIEIGNLGPLEARIDGWCRGYQELLRTKPAKGKRSDAAFALALKMHRDGWPWADLEATLRRWGKMVFSAEADADRIDRILDGLQTKLENPEHRKVIPSHKFVRTLLGRVPCPGGCDVDIQIQLHRGATLKEWPVDEVEFASLATVGPNLEAARDDLVHFYKIHVPEVLVVPNTVFQSAGVPGIGKTHRMLRLCSLIPSAILTPHTDELAKLKDDVEAELSKDELADATAMLEVLGEKLGIRLPAERPRVMVVEPRAAACEEPDLQTEIVRLEKLGHARLAAPRVCARCRRYQDRLRSCRYYAQFSPGPHTTVIATSAWLRLRQAEDLLRNVPLVILDEDALDFAHEELSMKADAVWDSIQFVVEHLPEFQGQLVPILQSLATAAAQDHLAAFQNARELAASIEIGSFNRRYKAVTEASAAETIPVLPLTHILSALRQNPRRRQQMLLAGKGKVIWRRLRVFPVRKPVIILDATGDRRLYEPIFPGRNIEVDTANVAQEAQVWQIYDQGLPASSFKSDDKIKEVRDIILALQADRADLGQDGFAVIGREKVVTRLDVPTQIKQGHYWKLRGSRAFEQCHTLVLVGAAEPDFVDAELRADLIFGRNLPRDRVSETRPYYLRSQPGMSWAIELEVYMDPDLRAYYERLREAEMVQAGFRLRPLHGSHKLIVVLSNIPLRGLPPTELMTMSQLEARLGVADPPTGQAFLMAKEQLRRQTGRQATQQQIADLFGVTREYVGQELRKLTQGS